MDTCILLPLLENTSRLKMMLRLIEVTTQSFNSPPPTNSWIAAVRASLNVYSVDIYLQNSVHCKTVNWELHTNCGITPWAIHFNVSSFFRNNT